MMNAALYQACLKKGLQPKHVAEVGVYLPETSNVLGFIQDGIRSDLFEADPEYVAKIREYFQSNANVKVFPCAIVDQPGPITFYRRGASTFAEEVGDSPAKVNDGYQLSDSDKFSVEGHRFNEFDDGTIDILSIDVEGGEWFVLKHMVSRPWVISVETHGRRYRNPHNAEIRDWMQNNGYGVWYRDKSDTVFYKHGVVELKGLEKLTAGYHASRFDRLAER